MCRSRAGSSATTRACRELSTEEIREAVSFAGRTMVRREPVGGWRRSSRPGATRSSWRSASWPRRWPRLHDRAQARGRDLAVGLHPGRGVRGGGLPARRLQPGHRPGQWPRCWPLTPAWTSCGGRADPGRRRIAAICGEALKPVSLELGGKSAAIVLDDVTCRRPRPGSAACARQLRAGVFHHVPGAGPAEPVRRGGLGAGVPGGRVHGGRPDAEETTMGRWPVPGSGCWWNPP